MSECVEFGLVPNPHPIFEIGMCVSTAGETEPQLVEYPDYAALDAVTGREVGILRDASSVTIDPTMSLAVIGDYIITTADITAIPGAVYQWTSIADRRYVRVAVSGAWQPWQKVPEIPSTIQPDMALLSDATGQWLVVRAVSNGVNVTGANPFMVRWDSTGQISFREPTLPQHAATKNYVDPKVIRTVTARPTDNVGQVAYNSTAFPTDGVRLWVRNGGSTTTWLPLKALATRDVSTLCEAAVRGAAKVVVRFTDDSVIFNVIPQVGAAPTAGVLMTTATLSANSILPNVPIGSIEHVSFYKDGLPLQASLAWDFSVNGQPKLTIYAGAGVDLTGAHAALHLRIGTFYPTTLPGSATA